MVCFVHIMRQPLRLHGNRGHIVRVGAEKSRKAHRKTIRSHLIDRWIYFFFVRSRRTHDAQRSRLNTFSIRRSAFFLAFPLFNFPNWFNKCEEINGDVKRLSSCAIFSFDFRLSGNVCRDGNHLELRIEIIRNGSRIAAREYNGEMFYRCLLSANMESNELNAARFIVIVVMNWCDSRVVHTYACAWGCHLLLYRAECRHTACFRKMVGIGAGCRRRQRRLVHCWM